MTHIWRNALLIECRLARGASLGETDYGISHFISHWEQISKAPYKPAGGPCLHLLPLEPELIAYHSKGPGFTAEGIKFWDLTPESLLAAWMEARLLRVTGPG